MFLAVLCWYLMYTEQLVSAFRAETATMTRIYAEVQSGLADPNEQAADRALFRLQDIVVGSGVPLIFSGPGDTTLAVVNLHFSAEIVTTEGQEEIREYARRLDARRSPAGNPSLTLVHFGDPPELIRLSWILWLQVAGFFLTFVTGLLVLRSQREAAADRAWTPMARELTRQLGIPILFAQRMA